MSDGGLGTLFQKHLPTYDWQRIESGGTGGGIPDLNGCKDGIECWIENKFIRSGEKICFETEQPGWIERRIRHGGRVFICVRRLVPAGPRRGAAVDQVRLYKGDSVRALMEHPGEVVPLVCGVGGPTGWPWVSIGQALREATFLSSESDARVVT